MSCTEKELFEKGQLFFLVVCCGIEIANILDFEVSVT